MDNVNNDTVDSIRENNASSHNVADKTGPEQMTVQALIDDLTKKKRNFKVTYTHPANDNSGWQDQHFKFKYDENEQKHSFHFKGKDKEINLEDLKFNVTDGEIVVKFQGIINNEEYLFTLRFIKKENSKKYAFNYYAKAIHKAPEFHHTSRQGGGRD